MRYRSAQGDETEREVDPYGVAYRGGAWYAVGHCHLRHDLRSFRLDRVSEVEPLPKSFGRPADFDVLGYLADAIARLPRTHSVEVLLHTDLPTARRHLRADLAQLQAVSGGVRMRAEVDELAWMARDLARLPFGFRIVKPDALEQELAEHLAQIARQLKPRPAAASSEGSPGRRRAAKRG
jgi:predicted DNA-binding transcriptional regulator YafY